MLTAEQNRLLTETGPGTPGGDLLRRYWQPVALTADLPPAGAPLPVRVLGEDLVLYRDEQGQPGLLGLHCPHRGADLSYGRLEDGGLRCLYHGWLFDRGGRCLDQPGEPAGSTFKDRIRQTAYPCQEAAGLILAYLGSDAPPLLPAYPFLRAPDTHVAVIKIWQACNYLQANEGNIDPAHLSFLHRSLQEQDTQRRVVAEIGKTANTLVSQDLAPTIDFAKTDFGLRICSLRTVAPDRDYLRITNFVLPNLSAFNGETSGAPYHGHSVNWHVPIDDTHHWKYMLAFSRQAPLDHAALRERYAAELGPDHRLVRDPSNRYQQDRAEMQTTTFTGLGRLFAVHDSWATQGEGAIQDRTTEHLGYGDKVITAARRLLLRAIADVQAGREPPHVVRDPADPLAVVDDFGQDE